MPVAPSSDIPTIPLPCRRLTPAGTFLLPRVAPGEQHQQEWDHHSGHQDQYYNHSEEIRHLLSSFQVAEGISIEI